MEERRTDDDPNEQRRRLKQAVQSENPVHQQNQQPQKCPRCESLNTKFCYYNNYSLSQPRYFCKTCRRYWTQGGTLRNVPVGGGCRRGKRPKTSSSSSSTCENSGSQQPSSPPAPPPYNFTNKEFVNFGLSSPANISVSPYFSGGGILSSLAAMQSFSRPPQGFINNQPVNFGGQFGGGFNLAMAHGFKVPSFGSQSQEAQQQHNHQIHQQREIYQMGNGDKNMEPMYQTDQSLAQTNRPLGSWTQNFINNNSAPSSSPSISNFWNNSSTSGSCMNLSQWPDNSPP